MVNVGYTCFCIQNEALNGVLEAPKAHLYMLKCRLYKFLRTKWRSEWNLRGSKSQWLRVQCGLRVLLRTNWGSEWSLGRSKSPFIRFHCRLYVFLRTKWSSGWRFVGLIAHLCVFNVGYMCFCVQSDAPKRFWEAAGIHLYSSKMLFVRPNARKLYVFLWVRACFEEFF